jgi:2-amino-4-hydroxy-6-hydroxymethyldihydropteridine diphosphokinase
MANLSVDNGLCAIGLGGNLGNSRAILNGAIDRLRIHPQMDVLAVSSWYRTAPIGPPQPDYVNGCATIRTSLAPLDLLDTVREIEVEFGRVRRDLWGARTLDLDLILYDNLVIDLPTLQIPHPRMLERAFVLVPLAEIAADWIEPRSGASISTLCNRLESSGVERLPE